MASRLKICAPSSGLYVIELSYDIYAFSNSGAWRDAYVKSASRETGFSATPVARFRSSTGSRVEYLTCERFELPLISSRTDCGMSEPLIYREIQFSRLGGTLPEKVGNFVVGIPSEAIEAYRKEHPTDTIDAAFRSLISGDEIDRMKDSLKLSATSEHVLIPFAGDLQSLGAPTLEGKNGRKFWKVLAKIP
jgi:hypothetical protein